MISVPQIPLRRVMYTVQGTCRPRDVAPYGVLCWARGQSKFVQESQQLWERDYSSARVDDPSIYVS